MLKMQLFTILLVLMIAVGCKSICKEDCCEVTTSDSFAGIMADPSNIQSQQRKGQGVPLAKVRDSFSKAKKLNSNLSLGFYNPAWVLDFSASGEGVTDNPSYTKKLIQDLKREVQPTSWGQAGVEVFREDQWLVIYQTAEVQKNIHAWLKEYEKKSMQDVQMVESTVSVLKMKKDPAEFFASMGIQANEKGHYSLSPSQIKSILDWQSVEVVNSPKLVSFSGQKAHISIVNQIAYVSDYEHFYLNQEEIADPVIDIIQSGLVVEICAKSLKKSNAIELKADVSTCQWNGNKTVMVDVSPTIRREIELPNVQTQRSTQELLMKSGQSILISPGLRKDGQWILLSAKSL